MYDPLHLDELNMATGEYKQLDKENLYKTRYQMQKDIKELEKQDKEQRHVI